MLKARIDRLSAILGQCKLAYIAAGQGGSPYVCEWQLAAQRLADAQFYLSNGYEDASARKACEALEFLRRIP